MDLLPNEILIRILKYLNTYDLMEFCKVFESLDYFLRDKSVIKCADWSNRFEIQDTNLCRFISIEMNPDFIKVLKINSIYWISLEDLRKLLRKLSSLEELHAVDTKLGFRSQDTVEYFNLKKLAVSVEDDHFEQETVISSKHLKSLKYLYLKILLKKEDHREIVSGLRLFFCNLKHLNELWIEDAHESLYRINYERLVVQIKSLQKFVLRSKSVLPLYDFSFVGLSKTFECKRCGTEGELIFEKVLNRRPSTKKSVFEPRESPLENAWDIFESLHADLPCGPKEYKLLNLREDIKNIQFEELNFCHTVLLCNSKYVEAALQILKTKNCKDLERLNFRSCLFQNFKQTRQQESDTVSFKKPRIGVKTNIDHPFKKIANNIKNLIELEISTCPGCNGGPVVSAYPLIASFEKLQKLSLEIPILLDGSFLEKVFQNCQNLEYLNLTLTSINETFLLNLYQCLQYAASLRNFRNLLLKVPSAMKFAVLRAIEGKIEDATKIMLVCPKVNLEKLFIGLCQIPRRKLQRIFIKCNNISYSVTANEKQLFSLFLEAQPQLIFFFLVASQATARQKSDIQKVFNEFKRGKPAKVFYCKKEIGPFSGVFPIPPAHHDMIFSRTRVSVIDFDKF